MPLIPDLPLNWHKLCFCLQQTNNKQTYLIKALMTSMLPSQMYILNPYFNLSKEFNTFSSLGF